jgi:hypothetical protein
MHCIDRPAIVGLVRSCRMALTQRPKRQRLETIISLPVASLPGHGIAVSFVVPLVMDIISVVVSIWKV